MSANSNPKKRIRQELQRITASEFATEVAHDEPLRVIRALRRFVSTVHHDRMIACGKEEAIEEEDIDDDDNDGSYHSQEEISSSPKPKKSKKEEESWKKDSENYNVPFVGTAVRSFYRSDPSPQLGEWPTGMLRAYILLSPLGTELTGDTMFRRIDKVRDTDRNLADRWTRCYIRALAALSSALHPIINDKQSNLQHASDHQYFGFAADIITKRLPEIFQILSEMSQQIQKNKKKSKENDDLIKTDHPQSMTVSAILEMLCHLAWHSPRVVARNLEQQQSQHKQPHKQQQPSSWRNWKAWLSLHQQQHKNWGVVMLAAILTEKAQTDAVVFSCIATVNNKGNSSSSSSGILIFVLKEALSSPLSITSTSLARLLRAVERLLRDRTSSRKRALLEIFCQREIIPNICQLAFSVSSEGDNQYSWRELLETVSQASGDDDNTLQPKQSASTEARRLLYVLVADRNRSPLLQGYEQNKSHFRDACEFILVRAMITLFEQDQNSSDMRQLLIRVLTTTPALLPAFFAKMSVIAPKDLQLVSLASLRRLHCVSHLIAHGPPVAMCWNHQSDQNKKIRRDDLAMQQSDALLLSAVLPSSLSKQVFSKLLQSSNALVVLEALKLYTLVLSRCSQLLRVISKASLEEHGNEKYIRPNFETALPDLKLLLTLSSKYNTWKQDQKSAAIIFGFICDVVARYVSTFSTDNLTNLVDWTKLLPSDAGAFCRSPLSVQRTVLMAIQRILAIQKLLKVDAKSYKILFQLVMMTRSTTIHRITRQLLIYQLSRYDIMIGDRDDECRLCREFEASCWIDGCCDEILEEICVLLEESSKMPLPPLALLFDAWKHCGLTCQLPDLRVSSLLLLAFHQMDTLSSAFVFFTVQVASKCLFYDTNPIPLCAVIMLASESGTKKLETMKLAPLFSYAKSLIQFNNCQAEDRFSFLQSLMLSYFEDDPVVNDSFENWENVENSFYRASQPDKMIMIRRIYHLSIVSDSKSCEKFTGLLKRLLPLVLVPFMLQVNQLFVRYDLYLDCLLKSSGNRQLSEVGDNSTPSAVLNYIRSDSLYCYMIAPFLTEKSLVEFLLIFLEKSEKDFSEMIFLQFLSKYLQLSIEKVNWKEVEPHLSTRLMQNAVKVWLTMTQRNSRAHCMVVRNLEEIIVLNLEENLISSFALYNFPSEDLVRRSVSSLLNQEDHFISGHSMLVVIIASDIAEFVPYFLRLHTEFLDKKKYLQMFYNGAFDEVFRKALYWIDQNGLYDRVLINLGNLLNKRAEKISDGFKYTECSCNSFLSLLIEFVGTKYMQLDEFRSVIALVQNAIEDAPNAFLKMSNVGSSLKEKILSLAEQIRLTLSVQHSTSIVSAMSNYLFNWIPISLKVHFRKKTALESIHEVHPTFLIKTAISLMTSDIEHLNSRIIYEESNISNFFRECIRCGLQAHGDVDSEALLPLCIRVVRLFVETINKSVPAEKMKLYALNLFGMVTNHSKFRKLLVPEKFESSRNNSVQRFEVILLIRCCLLLPNDIPFDSYVWECFLASYNAGVSIEDLVLRQILVLYAGKASTDSINRNQTRPVLLSQLRWGASEISPFSNSQWDWLADLIDVKRVHATLRNFPLYDTVDPFSSLSVDRWENALKAQANNSQIPSVTMDERYSPGFLLQLLLGSLEGFGDEEESARSSRITMAQRLCEKGGLAISLASLSSKCYGVRSLAVGILGLLCDLAESNDARKDVSWRERPQIVMLLDSVRTALVIRNAEVQKVSGILGDEKIPRLPGFTAIFLARAAFILCRPGDQLFSAVNQSFLRMEEDSGAFQDLTRVPAFVSLFCSSSDEKDKLFAERRFALELVKDGFIDDESYKLLASCHCSEMILACSSWNSPGTALDSSFSTEEIILILNTIKALLHKGGERSKTHLINHLGLLSWIRSILLGRPVLELLPSLPARISFLGLLKIVVQAATPELSSLETMTATSGVLNSALSLAIKSVHHGSEEARISILSCTVDIFEIVSVSLLEKRRSNESGERCPNIDQIHGIPIKSAAVFISMLPPSGSLQSALMSICSLPFWCNKEDSISVQKFCVNAIEFAGKEKDDMKFAVLRRILDLSSFCNESEMETEKILRHLVHWKGATSHNERLRNLWQNCLHTYTRLITNQGRSIPNWVKSIAPNDHLDILQDSTLSALLQ